MGKCVYVDNSNVWIEGKYHSAVSKGMVADVYEAHDNRICDMPWAYDFGKLLNIVCDGDISDIKRAVLYGSRPTDLKFSHPLVMRAIKKSVLTQVLIKKS